MAKSTHPTKTNKLAWTWATNALQGITYWIGHRHCFFRNHPIPEAALVAELCNLIYANLGNEFRLDCEVRYSEILKHFSDSHKSLDQKRADLMVSEKSGKDFIPKFIIEVKRSQAPKADIDSDLQRLAQIKKILGNKIHTFLFVISESQEL